MLQRFISCLIFIIIDPNWPQPCSWQIFATAARMVWYGMVWEVWREGFLPHSGRGLWRGCVHCPENFKIFGLEMVFPCTFWCVVINFRRCDTARSRTCLLGLHYIYKKYTRCRPYISDYIIAKSLFFYTQHQTWLGTYVVVAILCILETYLAAQKMATCSMGDLNPQNPLDMPLLTVFITLR